MSDQVVERLLIELEAAVKGEQALKDFFERYVASLEKANTSSEQMSARLREMQQAVKSAGDPAFVRFLGDVVTQLQKEKASLAETAQFVVALGENFRGLEQPVKHVISLFASKISPEIFLDLERQGTNIIDVLARAARAARASGGDIVEQLQAIDKAAKDINLSGVNIGNINFAQGGKIRNVGEEIAERAKQAKATATAISSQAVQDTKQEKRDVEDLVAAHQKRIEVQRALNQLFAEYITLRNTERKFDGETPQQTENFAIEAKEQLQGLAIFDDVERARQEAWARLESFEKQQRDKFVRAQERESAIAAQRESDAAVAAEQDKQKILLDATREIYRGVLAERNKLLDEGADPERVRKTVAIAKQAIARVNEQIREGIVQSTDEIKTALQREVDALTRAAVQSPNTPSALAAPAEKAAKAAQSLADSERAAAAARAESLKTEEQEAALLKELNALLDEYLKKRRAQKAAEGETPKQSEGFAYGARRIVTETILSLTDVSDAQTAREEFWKRLGEFEKAESEKFAKQRAFFAAQEADAAAATAHQSAGKQAQARVDAEKKAAAEVRAALTQIYQQIIAERNKLLDAGANPVAVQRAFDQAKQALTRVNEQIGKGAIKTPQEVEQAFQRETRAIAEATRALNENARATAGVATAARTAEGGLGGLLERFQRFQRRDTNEVMLQFFRTLERGVPVVGFLVNPLGTVLRQMTQMIQTGGALGSIFRTLEHTARGFLGSLIRIGENALGFVVGNILLAPFNALNHAIQNVTSNIGNYIRRGFELNSQLGKTQDQIAEEAKTWDKFLVVLTKPAYDFVIGKLEEVGRTLSKNFGAGADWRTNLFTFGAAFGDELQKALQNLLNFGQQVFAGGGTLDPERWLYAGANLAAQFGEGLIRGFLALVPLVSSLISKIAGFFIGQSPPPLGALRRIIEGGQGVINEWFRGMLMADFSMLDQLTSLVESKLQVMVANKDLLGSAVPGLIASARDQIADMLAELTTNGTVAASTLERIRGLFGDAYNDVVRVVQAMAEWRAATIAVEAAQNALNAATEHLRAIQEEVQNAIDAAQEHVKAVQEAVQNAIDAAQKSYEDAQRAVQAIQDKINEFEINTAEIPERFTRGRRRELDLELLAAQKRAQLAQQYVQDVQKAGQEQVKNAQKELEAIQKAGQERIKAAQKEVEAAQKALQSAQKEAQVKQQLLQLAERLLQEDIKRNQLLAQQLGQVFKLKIDIDPELKKKFDAIFEEINKIFQSKLADEVKILQDFFHTLFTGDVITEIGAEGTQTITQGSQLALGLRNALEDMQAAWNVVSTDLKEFFKALFGEKTVDANGVETAASSFGSLLHDIFATIKDVWDKLPDDAKKVVLVLIGLQVTTGVPMLLLSGLLSLLVIAPKVVLVLGLIAGAILAAKDAWENPMNSLFSVANPFGSMVAGLSLIKKSIDEMGGLGEAIDKYIVSPFRQAYEVLFGHSIIPDIEKGFDAFIVFLTNLPARIITTLGDIGTNLKNKAEEIYNGLPQWMRDSIEGRNPFPNLLSQGQPQKQGLGTGGEIGMPLPDPNAVKAQAQAIVNGAIEALAGGAVGIQKAAQDGSQSVTSAWQHTYDTVVGNSIVPDLVQQTLLWLTNLRDNTIVLINQMVVGAISQTNLLPTGIATSLNLTTTVIYSFISSIQLAWSNHWTWMQDYAITAANNIAQAMSAIFNGVALDVSGAVGGEALNRISATTEGNLGASQTRRLSERVVLESGLARVARAAEQRRSVQVIKNGESAVNVTINQTFPEGTPLWERDELRRVTRDAAHDAIIEVMEQVRKR